MMHPLIEVDVPEHDVVQSVDVITRQSFYNFGDQENGQRLNDRLPNLNAVEVENTFSLARCSQGDELSVIVFNMQRGGKWRESVGVLKEKKADIIILNEMDIGMARSAQQHTTRSLARALGMNYVWGVEFVELTRGTKSEQMATLNQSDFHGLHGNAILSRCQLRDYIIHRDPIGPYFSSRKSGLNAGGFEKRLGGRMVLLASIDLDDEVLVVGSMHKISSSTLIEARNYIGDKKAILGGDQGMQSCVKLGLFLLENAHSTWPATCDSYGHGTGDVICTNIPSTSNVSVHLPCIRSIVGNVHLSDHAILHTVLKL